MPHDQAEEFVSERLVPVAGTAQMAGMSRGEPGLPAPGHTERRPPQHTRVVDLGWPWLLQ